MTLLVDRYDAVLLDLDGTLFRGTEPIPAAGPTVAALRQLRTALAFMTNNSSSTPQSVARTLAAVGVGAEPEEVVTSAETTAAVLAERGVSTVFVVGEEGIRSALAARGVAVVDGEPDSVDAVVVGLDRGATYAGLRRASLLVDRGAALVATNADASFPAPGGDRWPGAGALLALVEVATGISADVIGKPHAPLFRAALRRAGGDTPLVVGDRLDTDIAGAAALGWDSLLVLTGVSGRDDLVDLPYAPTYVAEDIGALVDPTFVEAAGPPLAPQARAARGPAGMLAPDAQTEERR
jgi:glycerol-1-phosphatase